MTAKEYLSQAARINAKLKVMAEQLAYLKSAAQYVSPQISDMPKPAARNVHKNEDAIIRVMDFEKKMQEEHKKLNEINLVINAVEDPAQQTVLVKRYLLEMPWYAIAKAVFVSERCVYKIHNAALISVDEILKTVQ